MEAVKRGRSGQRRGRRCTGELQLENIFLNGFEIVDLHCFRHCGWLGLVRLAAGQADQGRFRHALVVNQILHGPVAGKERNVPFMNHGLQYHLDGVELLQAVQLRLALRHRLAEGSVPALVLLVQFLQKLSLLVL